jgi:hypothetical protein
VEHSTERIWEDGVPRRFVGWGPPSAMLPLLLNTDPQYRECYARARAAARQWELVEPVGPGRQPPPPPWLTGLAAQHPWMALDPSSGLPNELAQDQFLAADLGMRIEKQERPRRVTVIRLQDLFHAVLRINALDESWPTDKQIDVLLSGDEKYVAVTRDGGYISLMPRMSGLAGVVRSVVNG